MKANKYDWFEFGVFGVFKAEELPLHRDELKKYGQKCTDITLLVLLDKYFLIDLDK